MIKQAFIQLGGPDPKIRIARRGVDVGMAGPTDFLLHEDYLVAQPFFSKFVPCPFAGATDYTDRYAEVVVNDIPPGITSNPHFVIYPVHAGGIRVYPFAFAVSSVGGRAGMSYLIYYQVNSATSVTIKFNKSRVSLTSPAGANLIAYRQAE